MSIISFVLRRLCGGLLLLLVVDAGPDESAGACCTHADNITEAARGHRQAPAAALTAAGFVNYHYPTEWWHWSFGWRRSGGPGRGRQRTHLVGVYDAAVDQLVMHVEGNSPLPGGVAGSWSVHPAAQDRKRPYGPFRMPSFCC
ncbi:hypothetical protein GCM10010344_63480 [Streptomyces bluensis]|uniref:M15 family metallopeptidase n=1 Tax=Streptomyces bluensis TaxID=33897 RepID=UPI0016788505|nr:hypothetical protein GCM10010344_63480 [Streptomyces bluensis]